MPEARTTTMVQVRDVSKVFGAEDRSVEALQQIHMSVAEGEFIALVGPSGCGKSTLLNIVGGLVPPSAGVVEVGGRSVMGPPPQVGMMFQSAVLLEWRTAMSNVLLPIEVHGGRRAVKEATDRAGKLFDLVGLSGFENRYAGELSGGMQQRVALCRMLIADPEVLLLDEPFGALDELTREYMNVELERIVMQSGKTSILVTHSIQEAIFLADRVFVMTPRPGRFIGVVTVDLPKPRRIDTMTTEPFQRLVRQVRTLLEQEGGAPGSQGVNGGSASTARNGGGPRND